MLIRQFGLNDLYWSLTAVLLTAALLFHAPLALPAAMALCVMQIFHYRLLRGRIMAFPVQVRIAYLTLLVAGFVPALGFVHWIQLFGTWSAVTVDYCLLARLTSLLPWNRDEPFGFALVARTLFTPPSAWSPPAAARAHALSASLPA